MRILSLLSMGLLISALTATTALARQDSTLPYGTSQPQTDTTTMPNNSTTPSKGKMTEKTMCSDKNMSNKLAMQPNTNYREKGVQSSEQGKTLNQLKKERSSMGDQMKDDADCIPDK